MKQSLLLLSTLILSFQCTLSSTTNDQPSTDSLQLTDTIIRQNTPLHKYIDSAIVITDTSAIELGQFTFSHGNSSAKEMINSPVCKQWRLDSGIIVKILRHFKPIDRITLDLSFDKLPCELSGEVKISGVPYSMTINAGSYFMLITTDTTYLFADDKDKFLKYFLSGQYRGE
ncbi:hypothetical protein SAMN05428949_4776 [Chitinophaga sp. YR627]|uniref:hypothetical protein n=1 Tax=Chitinophaga sp. YR627 TaxID=1881041 RepID=UPI0008E3A054|nr:hypothetical protein [Chitinophaga sp. YR627]SFO28333.1 hypothetical protein SAMN05428949_4776 [Chitinophaga sp. YR627]